MTFIIKSSVWRCPVCGLEVSDETWRREKADRTVCQNQHIPTKMEFVKPITWEDLEKQRLAKLKEDGN